MLNIVTSLKNSVFVQTITEKKKKKVHQGIPVGGGMDTKKTFLNRCQQFSCNDQSIHITYLVFCLWDVFVLTDFYHLFQNHACTFWLTHSYVIIFWED